MDRQRFQRLEELLHAALEQPTAEREAFVAHACGEDAELRVEVSQLLAAGPTTGSLQRGIDAAAAGAFALGIPSEAPPAIPGYEVRRQVGAGGMGIVYEAYDHDLRRSLAIKVLHGQGAATRATDPVDARVLARFLDEAQVTGQLDHPGVVPVYELGRDPQARPYFAMRLVAGRTAAEVFALARAQDEGWTLTRALEVVLKICDTMAYAHDRGVIHRDLKPANVMVGRFGEVYVMDWGLAKVVNKEAARGVHVGEAAPDVGDGLMTLDGTVLGTPSYMAPEQATGRSEELDARSDVYAVGACLYTLLTGRQPYVQPAARTSAPVILDAVRAGPPPPVHTIDRTVPAELVAICDKAMARDRGGRYPGMEAMADDLRAFLGDRVVKAYRTGAVAELHKWVRRNRGMAAALVATFVTAVAGAIGIGSYAVRADENARLAERKSHEASENLDRFLQLADVVTLRDLQAEADELWPEVPELLEPMVDWVRRARQLADRLPLLAESLHAVEARGRPQSESEQDASRRAHPETVTLAHTLRRLAAAEQELAAQQLARDGGAAPDTGKERQLRQRVTRLRTTAGALTQTIEAALQPRFETVGDRFLYSTLDRLVKDLRALADRDKGTIAAVEARMVWARRVAERTLVQEQQAWAQAIASIADRSQCPKYDGLQLTPQVGLVPLGRNAATGLWEFWQPRTGTRPQADAEGRFVVGDQTSLVFVLIPGGTFWMGAQAKDPDGPNHDPLGLDTYTLPVHQVTLDPYFLSKYEMTQGQWQRFLGSNPSFFKTRRKNGRDLASLSDPVEVVSFEDCAEACRRMGCVLPTEAQWEYACRAGTTTPFHSGDSIESLQGVANLADESSLKYGGWPGQPGFDDGHRQHAPVGSYKANGFGLHDLHGNVAEWCGDWFAEYREPPRPGDGARRGDRTDQRILRGGHFNATAQFLRTATRQWVSPTYSIYWAGCRPARAIR